MIRSLVNHLFLPHYLPSSADDDYLIQHNHVNEYKLLVDMIAFLYSLKTMDSWKELPEFSILMDSIQRWVYLQNIQNFTVPNIQSTLKQIPQGGFLPLYFHSQNAAILIHIDEDNSQLASISAWQVLLPTREITSAMMSHLSYPPVTSFTIPHRSQLESKIHCELLVDFMQNTIEYATSYKDGHEFSEVRDVPVSHYMCQWWIEHFYDIPIGVTVQKCSQFKKKHRDQIRWNDALLPFRRSGLWMTMKVVILTILTKCLGNIGSVIYKLLITYFLTHTACRSRTIVTTDLLVHCTRKIVRRLSKIEYVMISTNRPEILEWIQATKQKIQTMLSEIVPKSDWQKSIQMKELTRYGRSLISMAFDDPEIYRHPCKELRVYLNNDNSNVEKQSKAKVSHQDIFAKMNSTDYIPSYDILVNKLKYTPITALVNMEIWVEMCLEKWLEDQECLIDKKHRFEILLDFFDKYQTEALRQYTSEQDATDPIGYSRFIITALTIIRTMHKCLCQDTRFERLKQHSIHIPNILQLFQFLTLPLQEDMIRMKSLYMYFAEFSRKQYPDLLENIKSPNAFGVYFASQSSSIIENMRCIYAQAEMDKSVKIQEVKNAKLRYDQLIDKVNKSFCQYNNNHHKAKQCTRCKSLKQANRIQVKIYECPLPTIRESALAVMFELQMPIELRCYRDVLWLFINRMQFKVDVPKIRWLNVFPHAGKLKPFFTGPMNHRVSLVSSTKCISQSHYSILPSIGSASEKDFLYENSLKVQISPTKPIKFDDECRILTPQLDHLDYKQLQSTINSTEFLQNQVIAQVFTYKAHLKPVQLVEFGSFRSGHRLQWWNLLAVLEMDSLPLAEESVAILIIHSIFQYGPHDFDSQPICDKWCPESHQQLLDDNFVDELIARLNHHLDECELNWQNELVLVVIIMITMRILTLCNPTREDRVAQLVIKCRTIGQKWIDLILKNIQIISPSALDEIENLRLKLVHVGIGCILTFLTHQNRIDLLISAHKHVMILLKATSTVHDYILLNKSSSKLSPFMRNLLRFSEQTLVTLQPSLSKFLHETSYQSLNDFTMTYWSVARRIGTMKAEWKKRYTSPYDGWYECQYQSRHISMDLIRGTILIDDMTIGFLPKTIINDNLYVRVFGDQVFEVQAATLPNGLVTKHSYHGDEEVLYEFYFDDRNNRLTVKEVYKNANQTLKLIPHGCFAKELPDIFVSNYSHWWDPNRQTISFRPVRFQENEFLKESYKLSLKTGFLIAVGKENQQTLVNQESTVFQNLFNRYFIRLDDKPFVYMMGENSSTNEPSIHVFLSRLGLGFQCRNDTKRIVSREYSDMYVDEHQWLGTLTGLTSGLLLSPSSSNNSKREYYPYRKLIMPFGEVICEKIPDDSHQTVSIKRAPTTPFLDQYFVFTLNDRLKILQSTDSPTGWLYLVLLHAMTSHALPDEYTGVTGMERAFQLLTSAGCWSDQPYDSISLNILWQIARISPKADYYPEHLTCMIKIDWNNNGLPASMQHFGYYLMVKKLIEASQKLNFMYLSTDKPEESTKFENKPYNESVLKKLYWDYRNSYNPLARLPIDVEQSISMTATTTGYKPDPNPCLSKINNSSVSLTNNLYKSGNVNLRDCSRQSWLPLSQWLNDENSIRSIWIGLLKKLVNIKSTTPYNHDKVEEFEKLISFLHYISLKQRTNSFYWQILKIALRRKTMLVSISQFPPFTAYSNIELSSFVKSLINLSSFYTSGTQNLIMTEVENCWKNDIEYKNSMDLATPADVSQINSLLRSWGNNRTLQTFLQRVQNQLCSTPMIDFSDGILDNTQNFAMEGISAHFQIRIVPTKKTIDKRLLQLADEKYNHPYVGHFSRPPTNFQHKSWQNEFPHQIFPSITQNNDPLNNIKNYFKKQLKTSWARLLSERIIAAPNPSIKAVVEYVESLRKESAESWQALVDSITESNEILFASGLLPRITPTTLISIFQRKTNNFNLTSSQITLLGGVIVSWIREQHMERIVYYTAHEQHDECVKELASIPHSNWIPSQYPLWLILELEMNITIREIQINVARHMMQSNVQETENIGIKNFVMQMNMGEGKTSVILPMLAASLSSVDTSLIRIIVLKSLFPTNYQSLRYKLGGLLNRRIFPFLCRRDMNFNIDQIKQITHRLAEGLHNADVVLCSPEDILSFDLLTIDKCRKTEFNVGSAMLSVQRWLRVFARDVLDESDEILHVKYQLVYTIGGQQSIDAGADRWIIVQSILQIVKKHAETIAKQFIDEVCYKPPHRKSSFPEFRIQSDEPYMMLCKIIANDWLEQRSYRSVDRELILSFLLDRNLSIEHMNNKFPHQDIQHFLIVRGLLSCEVLLVALKKRHRVNYGVVTNPFFKRQMAVPFRAKDVAADRTEFGHPDVAIVLTQLAYYYSGLTDVQLMECFNRFNDRENEPASVYEEWISSEDPNQVPPSIKQWKAVNLKDYHQRTLELFPTLRYNMRVINYFLHHFTFPFEVKQFPHRVLSSAWDLSSSLRSKVVSGFSGTNDTQLLLPTHICQCDLPELKKTDAIVINNLLQHENENYRDLPINVTFEDILRLILQHPKPINVILDVGALFIDGTNRDIAVKWLKLSNSNLIDYAVYFKSNSIVVCDRRFHEHQFETSPASERLDRCIFYLDDIHTRGTDFKFPKGFQAAVTLGTHLTKDRFVQACMRMRKLGKGHRLTFWSSNEVHQQITKLKKHSCAENQESNIDSFVDQTDILRWVYENTYQAIWDGLHHWGVQSISFQRKVNALKTIHWENQQQQVTNTMMSSLAIKCLEPEVIELTSMYGAARIPKTIETIYLDQSKFCDGYQVNAIHNAVIQRLKDYGGTKQRLSTLLDEEQQRE